MSTPLDFSTLLASSVHDVKNSVLLLQTSLDEWVDNGLPEHDEDRNRIATLRRESACINNALISLLGLYRLEQNQLCLNTDEVYLYDFLEEQIAAHDLLFEINNISVTLCCDEELVGYFDPQMISGVIGNVMVNAIRYTNTQIVLQAYMDTCGFTGEEGAGCRSEPCLVIKVKDDGPGYPQTLINQLYETLEKGIDFTTGSTSLGLFFARQVASLHTNNGNKGSIALCNLDEGGACFQIRLP